MRNECFPDVFVTKVSYKVLFCWCSLVCYMLC